MAEELVTSERLKAGADYLAALSTLGFHPEGALWSVRSGDPGTLELSLFTDLVDRIGTREIYRVLFDAFDKARTPPSLDPWLVGLYSPRQMFFDAVADFDFASVDPGKGAAFVMSGGKEYDDGVRALRITEFEVVRLVHPEWVYRIPRRRQSSAADRLRSWHRFERAIADAA